MGDSLGQPQAHSIPQTDPPAHLFPQPVPTEANTKGSLSFQLVFQMKQWSLGPAATCGFGGECHYNHDGNNSGALSPLMATLMET